MESLCKFYISCGYCKKFQNEIAQYEAFYLAVLRIGNDRQNMLRSIIHASPGLRDYMIIHAAFTFHYEDSELVKPTDWLYEEMLDILTPTTEDIERIQKVEYVPSALLEKLSIFDPELISIEHDPVRIEFDFYGMRDAIDMIDMDWEQIALEAESANVTNTLSEYEPIAAGTQPDRGGLFNEIYEFTEDLPF